MVIFYQLCGLNVELYVHTIEKENVAYIVQAKRDAISFVVSSLETKVKPSQRNPKVTLTMAAIRIRSNVCSYELCKHYYPALHVTSYIRHKILHEQNIS